MKNAFHEGFAAFGKTPKIVNPYPVGFYEWNQWEEGNSSAWEINEEFEQEDEEAEFEMDNLLDEYKLNNNWYKE